MKARRANLSGGMVEELCREIQQGRLGPGTALGTEADLAQRFGVSRTVVREAIGHLRGLGVVTSRQGLGLSVGVGDVMGTVAKAFVPLVAGSEHWPDLCHLRFVLEVGSVPIAVERATAAQVARMRELAAEMLKLVRKRTRNSLEVRRQIVGREIEFHQLVLDAAGGRLAGQFHKILVGYFDAAYGQGPHSGPPSAKDMQDHVALVEAFAGRDSARAVAVLADHIRPMLEVGP